MKSRQRLNSAHQSDQFKQSFREEAREILVDLESALLELNEHPADLELIGRTFRGLHTIKGSGSMFGFERLAAFTHNLETSFDEVRNGRLEVTPELIDLTLSALDQMRVRLEEGAGSAAHDPAVCQAILDRVRKLSGSAVVPASADDEGSEAGATSASSSSATGLSAPFAMEGQNPGHVSGPIRAWHIRFAPGPEMLLDGTDPLLLLRELGSLGGLSVRASFSALPPLAELEPERCYVAWDLALATASPLEAIRDVFIFVEDHCELGIEPAEEPEATAGADPARPRPAGAAPAGEVLARGLEEPRSQAGGRRNYDQPDNATSLRVPAAKLDQFVDLVGELVTVQARLSELAARSDDPDVAAVSEEIERLTSSLRENSMNIRMLPIRATFEKFRRLVHDLARDLGKDVELTMEGADTELDKTVIDQLGDPLMHLIRNSMDHGIEPAARRAALGKRRTASIHLSARHSGASVLIGVADDGAGIDAEAVRARAIEKGLVAPSAELTETQIFGLLFEPGFSTAKQVTDVSGRGVGMDVVRQRVDALRGTIEVSSRPGEGTSVTLRLPLTLAIIDGLLVSVGEAFFVLPLGSTLECVELSRADVQRANGKHVADVRGELIPYIRLREYFNMRCQPPAIEQVMIVETGEGHYGFVVDCVLGDCQTVIKNLGRCYRNVQVVSGATILGNGTVALILDPERLVQAVLRTQAQRARGHPAAQRAGSLNQEQLVHQANHCIGGDGSNASASPLAN
jgi:two-component system chemotaxis sensor kinase CheA